MDPGDPAERVERLPIDHAHPPSCSPPAETACSDHVLTGLNTRGFSAHMQAAAILHARDTTSTSGRRWSVHHTAWSTTKSARLGHVLVPLRTCRANIVSART